MKNIKKEIFVSSDIYFNNPGRFDAYEEIGMDCIPTDAFGGYVQKGKKGNGLTAEGLKENLDNNLAAIKDKFSW